MTQFVTSLQIHYILMSSYLASAISYCIFFSCLIVSSAKNIKPNNILQLIFDKKIRCDYSLQEVSAND